jgi:hypothetical protein
MAVAILTNNPSYTLSGGPMKAINVKMAMWLIAALFTSKSAFAQREELLTAIVGTVQSVTGDQIHVLSGEKLLTLHVDDHTEIWKGKALPDAFTVGIGR